MSVVEKDTFDRLRARYADTEQLGAAYASWQSLGIETKQAIVDLLPEDWSFEGKRMLDFGCGAGRTLSEFLPEAETAEFFGTDIDGPSIEWLKQLHSPPLHLSRCDENPPLDLEYGTFDLAWAVSVFTHLPDNSIPWLLELHRLLKPGGLLIATYAGRWNSEFVAGEPWDEDRVGMNVLFHTQPWNHGGPTVLISDWWVREHWGRAFDVLEIAPRIHNMSWALLRKRDVEVTAEELERPGDDPREYRAIKHNLAQVQRELSCTEGVCVKVIEDVRREYESSLSWRLSRPVRIAKARAGELRARRGR